MAVDVRVTVHHAAQTSRGATPPIAGFPPGRGDRSHARDLPGDPTVTDKANFGFVSKYHQGADVPAGETGFRFKVADFNFHSHDYDWLVVSGARARNKGVGIIYGEGEYALMLTATDGDVNGGDEVDRFRIKICDKATEEIFYDNQMGEADDSDAATVIGGGSILVHKGE